MSDMDQLRMLKQSAEAARRQHISRALGRAHPPASTGRLPGLQRMLNRVGQALRQPSRGPAAGSDSPRSDTPHGGSLLKGRG